jgi:glycosyltransferase domain-containing protein
MNELSKLTVLVLSKNRPFFLKRQIDFWKTASVRMIVLDGSNVAILNQNEIINHPNIRYIHDPNKYNSGGTNLFNRFKTVTNLIETQYSMIMSDDDLFLPTGLIAAIKFLDLNDDFVSCIGQVLGLNPVPHLNSIEFKRVYAELNECSSTSDILSERVKTSLQTYSPLIMYSVQRSEVLKKSLTAIGEMVTLDVKNYDDQLTESLLIFGTSFQGKSATVQNISWLRSSEADKIWRNSKGGSFLFKKNSSDFSRQGEDFLNLYTSKLSECIGIEKTVILNIVAQNLKEMQLKILINRYKIDLILILKKVVDSLYRFLKFYFPRLSYYFLTLAKRFFHFRQALFLYSKGEELSTKVIDDLSDLNLFVSFNDLDKVCDHIFAEQRKR